MVSPVGSDHTFLWGSSQWTTLPSAWVLEQDFGPTSAKQEASDRRTAGTECLIIRALRASSHTVDRRSLAVYGAKIVI